MASGAAAAAKEQAEQVGEKAGERASQMGGQAQGVWQRMKRRSPLGPLGWAGIVAVSATVVGVSAIGLVLVSPVLLLFSPVLVPLGIVVFTCTAAAATAGGSTVAAVSAAAWLYRYLKGKHPRGSDQADRLLHSALDSAQHLKDKAHDVAAAHIPL